MKFSKIKTNTNNSHLRRSCWHHSFLPCANISRRPHEKKTFGNLAHKTDTLDTFASRITISQFAPFPFAKKVETPSRFSQGSLCSASRGFVLYCKDISPPFCCWFGSSQTLDGGRKNPASAMGGVFLIFPPLRWWRGRNPLVQSVFQMSFKDLFPYHNSNTRNHRKSSSQGRPLRMYLCSTTIGESEYRKWL